MSIAAFSNSRPAARGLVSGRPAAMIHSRRSALGSSDSSRVAPDSDRSLLALGRRAYVLGRIDLGSLRA
jgi:hypothetical protein